LPVRIVGTMEYLERLVLTQWFTLSDKMLVALGGKCVAVRQKFAVTPVMNDKLTTSSCASDDAEHMEYQVGVAVAASGW
jgi:hypothetical protein